MNVRRPTKNTETLRPKTTQSEKKWSVKGWKHYHILQVKESYCKNTNVILTFLAVMEKGQLDEGF